MYSETALGWGGVLWRSAGGGSSRIPADGCVDLILREDSVAIAGPSTKWIQTELDGSRPTLGVRFAPGFAAGVLGAPLSELRDAHVPLADVLPASRTRVIQDELRRQLDAADSPRSLTVLAETLPTAPGWVAAVRLGAHGGASIAALVRELGWSERELRRRMSTTFGYGYRSLVLIERASRARRLIDQGSSLTAAAAVAGYADQSHLSRDFTRLVGVTPGQFAARAA